MTAAARKASTHSKENYTLVKGYWNSIFSTDFTTSNNKSNTKNQLQHWFEWVIVRSYRRYIPCIMVKFFMNKARHFLALKLVGPPNATLELTLDGICGSPRVQKRKMWKLIQVPK